MSSNSGGEGVGVGGKIDGEEMMSYRERNEGLSGWRRIRFGEYACCDAPQRNGSIAGSVHRA